MLIALLSKWGCNICSYLYPAYASYKALSLHPDSSPEAMAQVERWLMYWSVVGTWTAVEAVLGWTFTWLPFYSLIKAMIFLYFSLPQSEGSTYIYRAHLAPLFNEHESDIDSFLASLRTRATSALAGGIGWIWEKAKAQLNLALPAGSGQQACPPSGTLQYPEGLEGFGTPSVRQPPTLQDPASGAIQQMYGLMSHYAGHYMPVAISALTAAAGAAQARAQPHPTRAEQVPESMSMPVPVPTAGVRTPSDSTLRSRTYMLATNNGTGAPGDGYHVPSPSPGAGSGLTQGQQSQSQGLASGRLNRDPNAGRGLTPQGRPSPNLSSHTSEESLGGFGQPQQNRWSGEMSYESINREEAQGAPGVPPFVGEGARPGIEKRGSSWWGWGGSGSGTPERPKNE